MKPLRHSLSTRLAHAGLAIAVILQLGTSLFMQVPRGDYPANFAFEMHETSGVVALFFVFSFWVVAMTRIVGTDAGRLFPWVSADRLKALRDDVATHWNALRKLRLPPYDPEGALSSAVHGLGLLLMTYMALSGTLYLLAPKAGLENSSLLHTIMDVHGAFGNLVWAYFVGHAGLAVIHHFTGGLSLTEICSPRLDAPVSEPQK